VRINRVDIVTVSACGAEVFWRANRPADIHASCRPASGGGSANSAVDSVNGRHFRAVFSGLHADTAYTFQLALDGRILHSGEFKTLRPAPGDFIFRFATVNDIHIGEKIYGLIFLPCLNLFPVTPGLKLDIDGEPFWKYTNETAIKELNKLDLDFVIVKGDVVTDHTEANIRVAKEMLDTLKHPYRVLRGNHDRAANTKDDFFLQAFPAATELQSFEHKGRGFILLDDIHPETGNTRFSARTIELFKKEMERMRHIPVFVFAHNPPLRAFERAPDNRISEFLEIIDTHPGVAGVFCGHTHGNKVAIRKRNGKQTLFVETAAPMDYPGGYNIYEVHAGGYVQTCVRPFCEKSARWHEKCEKAYYGLAASGLFGDISDRNFVRSLK
jgi:3',5'-cyclic AMP phosphodiesterase CpdA